MRHTTNPAQRKPTVIRFTYWLLFFFSQMLPKQCTYTVAYFIGTLSWILTEQTRRHLRNNLAVILPSQKNDALDRTVRKNYINFFITIFDHSNISGINAVEAIKPEKLDIIDPYQVFKNAPLSGPVITTTIHTNWELVTAYLHFLNWIENLQIITLDHKDEYINNLFAQQRKAVQGESIALGKAPLATLRSLRQGRAVGIAGDRLYGSHGIRAAVSRGYTTLPVGPASLAVQTQAPIIPVLLARRSFQKYMLIVGKPIVANSTQNKNEQVMRISGELGSMYGRFIEAAPTQWVAFQPFWEHTLKN